MFPPFLRIAVNAPRVSKKITRATALQLSKVFKNMDKKIELILTALSKNRDNRIELEDLYSFVENDMILEDFFKITDSLDNNKLIENDGKLIITDRGMKELNTYQQSEIIRKEKLQIQKQKEEIDFEKSKIDFELSKETLKEFPKTKKRAKVAYIIAIVLAFVQVIQWIIKLLSLS